MMYRQSTFNMLYEKFSTQFLEEYCNARHLQHSHDVALYVAKIATMDSLVYSIHREYKNRFILFKVHKTLRDDQSLSTKAIEKFSLVDLKYLN
jgi:hypothetical protein